MTDSTWIRAYGGKSILTTANIQRAKVMATGRSVNPASGVDTFALLADGTYGGGIGISDGAGDWGIYADTAGGNLRFASGAN